MYDNAHLLMKKYDLSKNSFISNVNTLVNNLDTIEEINDKFDKDSIDTLVNVVTDNEGTFNLKAVTEDLNKSTYKGKRKLDIDVMKNFRDYDKDLSSDEKKALCDDTKNHVYYKAAIAYFTDVVTSNKSTLTIDFDTPKWSNTEILAELDKSEEFKARYGNASVLDAISDEIEDHHIVRIVDDPDEIVGTNLTALMLVYIDNQHCSYYDPNFVGAKSVGNSDYPNITFTWSDTTSTLSVITSNLTSIITAAQESEFVKEYQSQIKEDYENSIASINKTTNTNTDSINTLTSSSINQINNAGQEQIRQINAAVGNVVTVVAANALRERTWVLANDIPAGTELILSDNNTITYYAGMHQLMITYDGVMLSNSFYEEIGEYQTISNSIKINIDLVAGQELTVRTFAFGQVNVDKYMAKIDDLLTRVKALEEKAGV
jgi:hypothetical protein